MDTKIDKNKKAPLKTTRDLMKEDEREKTILPDETDEERLIGVEAHDLFTIWRNNRDTRMQLFDGKNLVDYINDSVYRYTTNIFERDNLEEWQSRTNVPMTRNKINQISGRSIQSMPIGQIMPHGTGKYRRATILNNLNEFSEDTAKYSSTMAEFTTEAMVKGTSVAYEGHDKSINLLRELKKDGTVSEIKEVKNELITTIVNLEDFYPSTVFVNSVNQLSGAAWREILDYDEFIVKYGSFDKAAEIPAFSNVAADDFPAYRDDASKHFGDGKVEVLHIYKKNTDEYIILANGFILNPLKLENGTVTTYPMPFKHKSLPFFSMKFESLSSNFFYGKSMPDKLSASNDMLNVMTNMTFDQSVMALYSPIITSSTDYIEDDFLKPGRRIAIDTNGLPIDSVIKELKISPPSGWYQYILSYTKNIIEEASVDALSSGSTSGLADRTTAKAVETAAAGVASALSYFGLQIREAVKDKTRLRIGNILQVYFDKSNPLAHKIIGEKISYINSAFNEFSIENAELSPGKDGKVTRGKKIIEIYSSKEEMPTGDELEARAVVEKVTTGKDIEIVALPSDYFRDMFKFDVKVTADKRNETTQATEQAIAMYKAQTYMQLGQGRVNVDEILADLMEKNGDDPTKFLLAFEEQDKSQMPENQQAGAQGGQGGMPGGGGGGNNVGNNLTQQVAGATQRIK